MRAWFPLPVLDDPDRARDARTLYWLATRGLAVAAVIVPASQIVLPSYNSLFGVYLPGIAILFGLLALVSFGKVRAATVLAPLLLFGLGSVVLWRLGLRGTHGFVFVFAIVFASALWPPRAVATLTAASALVIFGYVLLVQHGALAPPAPIGDLRYWIGATAALGGTWVGLNVIIGNERAALARFAGMVNGSPDGVLSIDRDGAITSVNPAAEAILGIDRRAVIGRPADRRIVGDSVTGAEFLSGLRTAVPGKTIGPVTLSLATAGGDDRTIEVVGRGLDREVLLILRDVTERLRLEQQLLRAQRMEALGQLASGVAHEFNNGLSVILANSSYLLRRAGTVDRKLVDCLHDIKASCVRTAALTRQLLAFSRNQVYESELLSPGEVLLGMREMLQRTLGEDITLSVDCDADAGAVWLDRSQLEQAVLNLCVNARAALPGGGHLTITCDPSHEDEGERVDIRVADDGTGMTTEVVERIFEPFFTTKSPDEGTGLGLAMVRTFVERSGGTIRVDSAPGRGSVFTLRFPVRAAAPAQASAGALAAPRPAPVGRPRVVLLVENDELVRRSARRILEEAGHTVIAAEGAEAALALCEHHMSELDVLVTDIVMPGMSGCELADILHARRPDLGLVLMSGHADPDKTGLDRRRHELTVLAKPFAPESLLERVERSRSSDQPSA